MFELQPISTWMDTLAEGFALAMHRSVRVSPPNSLVFISDPNGGDAPVPTRGAMILSSPSCISVGCFPEIDGETEIILGPASEVGLNRLSDFVGTLETPNRIVAVSTVEGATLLDVRVPASTTRVRIWLSDPRWPDKVIIGLGQ